MSIASCVALPAEAPPRSRITSCETTPAPPEGASGFVILESVADPGAYQLVPPDIATCAACRGELLDPADRRYEYPFTNCTDCGPRFTIIEDLPYDRERTTMRRFPLCPACRREYEDPADRRFHAEPNACPVCGPKVRLLRRGPESGGSAGAGEDLETLTVGTADDPAGPIRAAGELLRNGEILAVKGLGGFHLACDATAGDVVRAIEGAQAPPSQAARRDVPRTGGTAGALPRRRSRGGAAHLAGAPHRAARRGAGTDRRPRST